MVQNKKNFSPGKKLSEDRQDLDRKNTSRTADRPIDGRAGNVKNQSNIAKDKTAPQKRDMGSRK